MSSHGDANTLLLGIDGGGTRCRARLCTVFLEQIGEGTAGPANIRLGVEQSFASVHQATIQCLNEAGLSPRDLGRTVACLALAGASEPSLLDAARRHQHPYRQALFVPDAQAACIGAHRGRSGGGIIVVGTGTIGWVQVHGRHHKVGGWGGRLPTKEAAPGSAARACAARSGPMTAASHGPDC